MWTRFTSCAIGYCTEQCLVLISLNRLQNQRLVLVEKLMPIKKECYNSNGVFLHLIEEALSVVLLPALSQTYAFSLVQKKLVKYDYFDKVHSFVTTLSKTIKLATERHVLSDSSFGTLLIK